MDSYSELEYKYKADNIGLKSFLTLMESLQIKNKMTISSWDIYYTPKESSESEDFIRFRMSTTPELTKKVKTKNTNNWARIEVDLPLDPEKTNEGIVSKFLDLEGYVPNFKIYKSCFVFWLEEVNFVYYIVYDEDMAEQGRFIEVEINKDKIPELEQGVGAEYELKVSAKILEKLGLTSQHRLKKSLFELFKK
jgi:adenylate cyclase class IV